ncbi:MAG: hypothetical protein KDC41_23100, partial [Saprospiraceae bacterium]|nr:hypothetical protein [Saprospiraceae bacterium]
VFFQAHQAFIPEPILPAEFSASAGLQIDSPKTLQGGNPQASIGCTAQLIDQACDWQGLTVFQPGIDLMGGEVDDQQFILVGHQGHTRRIEEGEFFEILANWKRKLGPAAVEP